MIHYPKEFIRDCIESLCGLECLWWNFTFDGAVIFTFGSPTATGNSSDIKLPVAFVETLFSEWKGRLHRWIAESEEVLFS